MATVSVNHVNCATSLDTQVKGTMTLRERRQVLVLVMTIIRPVQRLVRKEAERRGARHDEVDKFSALVANRRRRRRR